MKKSFLFLAINFIGFNCFAQWQTGTNNTYTTSPVVTIGASSIQGSYGNPITSSALEIVSPQGSGSMLNFKTGNESAFISFHSVYPSGFYLPSTRTFGFFVNSASIPSLHFQTNGNVSIGRTGGPVDYKLAVAGKIIAEELKVQLQGQWPDYVFDKKYTLPTLTEVEKHIQEKGHLINVPSACEVELNGIQVGEMAKIQQEKIEELTLYIIEQNKINEKQATQLQEQAKQIESLKVLVNKLIEKQ